MTPGPIAVHVAAGLVRRWADWYTRAVDGEAAERRRAEIASDLWEQQAQALRDGTPSWLLALSVTRRVIVGMAADLSWAHAARSGSASAIPVRGAAWLVSGWSRIASAALLLVLYVLIVGLSPREPGQVHLADAALMFAGIALLAIGLVFRLRARRFADVALSIGATPALLARWMPGVGALATFVVIAAVTDLAGLDIAGGRAGGATAATGDLGLVFASLGPMLLGWGYHWPLVGLGCAVVIGLTARRQTRQQ